MYICIGREREGTGGKDKHEEVYKKKERNNERKEAK